MNLIRVAMGLFMLSAWFLLPGCDARAADKEEIEQVYADLDRCNNSKNGAAALEIFTKESFAEYDRLLKIGLDGTAEEVKALGPVQQLEVMRMRVRAKRSDVAGKSGREYVEFATSRGWYVAPPEDHTMELLKKFRFAQDGSATAEVISDGDSTGVRLRFVKQEERWRFDEVYANKQWDAVLRRAAREEGLSEDELLLEILSDEVKQEIPDSVWQPMTDEKKAAAAVIIKPERSTTVKTKKR
jgi:hypothetical protein